MWWLIAGIIGIIAVIVFGIFYVCIRVGDTDEDEEKITNENDKDN